MHERNGNTFLQTDPALFGNTLSSKFVFFKMSEIKVARQSVLVVQSEGFVCACVLTQSCLTFLQPHRLQPARFLCPWDSPGKNTGVSYHFLLQGIFPTQGLNPSLLHWQGDSLLLSHQGSMALCVALENCTLSIIVVYFHPTSCKTAFLLRAHPYRGNKCHVSSLLFPAEFAFCFLTSVSFPI